MNFNIDITKLDVYERCLAEVNDPGFDHGSHGVAGTYRDGCRGPLCSYARSTAQTRGPAFLSTDLIEYICIYLWLDSYAKRGEVRTIYEAPKNLRMYYVRLDEHGLTYNLGDNKDMVDRYEAERKVIPRKTPPLPHSPDN